MEHLTRAIPAAFSLFFLTSCAVHNTPGGDLAPNRITSAQKAQAFVDQNGTFYPDDWKSRFDAPPASGFRSAYSLNTMATWDSATAWLSAEEDRVLDQLEAFIQSRTRVFILIHGFNSSEQASREAYSMIEESLALAPSDGILEFHWDGLVAKGLLIDKPSAGKIWFNATGYSQLAGARGLRRILNRTDGKEVVIIAHSRGASVTLSAFSDPPYSTSFGWATLREHYVDVWKNDPLRENGNRITAFFLAPAIGEVDFRTVHYYHGDWTYRSFGPQVTRIFHTINGNDPVLRKPLGLSAYFNPTNLGYDRSVRDMIAPHYRNGFLTYADFSGMKSHDFRDYVSHPCFKRLLNSAGIRTTDGDEQTPSPPRRRPRVRECRWTPEDKHQP